MQEANLKQCSVINTTPPIRMLEAYGGRGNGLEIRFTAKQKGGGLPF